MSFTISNSSQFRIKDIAIITKGSPQPIDITSLYEELNIFDSLYLPLMSGNILITDALGLSDKLAFDGSEVLAINIEKTSDNELASFKKAFRIYKQTDRRNINQTSERYILNFSFLNNKE